MRTVKVKEERIVRAKKSRIADNLRTTYIPQPIGEITVSEYPPATHLGYVEMVPANSTERTRILDEMVTDHIPATQWSFSNEAPHRGIEIWIKTATLYGRSRTYFRERPMNPLL